MNSSSLSNVTCNEKHLKNKLVYILYLSKLKGLKRFWKLRNFTQISHHRMFTA